MMEKGGLVGIASKIHVKCTFVVVKKKKKNVGPKGTAETEETFFFFNQTSGCGDFDALALSRGICS